MQQPPTKSEVHFHFQHYSAGWNWPLTLWPWTWCTLLHVRRATFPPILVILGRVVLHLSANTWQTRHITLRPWPLRSWRLSLMQIFVFHLCTKFEVHRHSHSEDMTHFWSQHNSAWWPWPWNWCALLPVGWTIFIPILVFIGCFVLDL